MKIDFESTLDHRRNGSRRWKQPEGRTDIIGMGTADMDYTCTPIIKERMAKILEDNTYNYRHTPDSYYESVLGFFKRNYNLNASKEWLTDVPGTLASIRMLLDCFTEKNDNVIMQSPYFSPLKLIIERTGCNFISNPMILKGERYEVDFEDFEMKIKKYKPAVFLLVNPQNPVGRVFSKEELERFVDICYEYDVLIISDEVHFLITFDGVKHIPILALNDKAKEISIQVFSMSKGFNMMSLPHAMQFIANVDLMRKWYDYYYAFEFFYGSNLFSIAAVTGATSPEAQVWLNEATLYIKENIDIFMNYIKERNIPLKPIKPEASYIIWVDCRESGIDAGKLSKVFLEDAGISLNNGLDHGEDGRGFVRINLAVTRTVLMEALTRIESLFIKLT